MMRDRNQLRKKCIVVSGIFSEKVFSQTVLRALLVAFAMCAVRVHAHQVGASGQESESNAVGRLIFLPSWPWAGSDVLFNMQVGPTVWYGIMTDRIG